MSIPARGFCSYAVLQNYPFQSQPNAVLTVVSSPKSSGPVDVNDNNVNEHNLIVITFISVPSGGHFQSEWPLAVEVSATGCGNRR